VTDPARATYAARVTKRAGEDQACFRDSPGKEPMHARGPVDDLLAEHLRSVSGRAPCQDRARGPGRDREQFVEMEKGW
jgi:hypothetical protein